MVNHATRLIGILIDSTVQVWGAGQKYLNRWTIVHDRHAIQAGFMLLAAHRRVAGANRHQARARGLMEKDIDLVRAHRFGYQVARVIECWAQLWCLDGEQALE